MNKYKYLLSCVSGIALLLSQTNMVSAQETDTGILNVSATPIAECQFDSATDIDFGDIDTVAYDKLAAESMKSSTVSIACSNNANYHLEASNGNNFDSANGLRRLKMTDTTDHFIIYKLYKDSAGTSLWENGALQSSLIGNGSSQSYTFYARIEDSFSELSNLSYNKIYTDTIKISYVIN